MGIDGRNLEGTMIFQIAWPNGSRTKKRITSMRQLDHFVSTQFALGLEVDLRPTEAGPLLIIGDGFFEGEPIALST